MHLHPEDALIDRETFPGGAVIVRDREEGASHGSFPPTWTDEQINHAIAICHKAYEEGVRDGITEGKAIIRRAILTD